MVLIYPKSITFLYALIIQYTRGFCSVLTPPRNKICQGKNRTFICKNYIFTVINMDSILLLSIEQMCCLVHVVYLLILIAWNINIHQHSLMPNMLQ